MQLHVNCEWSTSPRTFALTLVKTLFREEEELVDHNVFCGKGKAPIDQERNSLIKGYLTPFFGPDDVQRGINGINIHLRKNVKSQFLIMFKAKPATFISLTEFVAFTCLHFCNIWCFHLMMLQLEKSAFRVPVIWRQTSISDELCSGILHYIFDFQIISCKPLNYVLACIRIMFGW